MSLQVGAFCYANAVEAGRAACSQFVSSTVLSGNTVKTVTCAGYDLTTGALQLSVRTTDTTTQSSVVETLSQAISFPDCVQGDYLDAAEVVIGGLLACYVVYVCGWKLLSFLGWSRGDQNV